MIKCAPLVPPSHRPAKAASGKSSFSANSSCKPLQSNFCVSLMLRGSYFCSSLILLCRHACTMPLHAATERARAAAVAAQGSRQEKVYHVYFVLGALSRAVGASPQSRLDAPPQQAPPGGGLEDGPQKTNSLSVFSCLASQDHPRVRSTSKLALPWQRSVVQCPMESSGYFEHANVKVASVSTPSWCMASSACFAAYSKAVSW